MVHEYNTSASTQSLTSKMSAFVGNIHDPTEPSPSAFQGEAFHDFDLAVVGLGFHHFSDPSRAAAKLAERLKTGGVLLILDFVVDEKSGEGGDGQNHGHGFWQKHGHGNGGVATAAKRGKQGGFGKEDIDKIFEGAGVGKDFGFEVIAKGAAFETEKHSMTADVFMARGTKA
jgi:SAM-dependent methyltransferase